MIIIMGETVSSMLRGSIDHIPFYLYKSQWGGVRHVPDAGVGYLQCWVQTLVCLYELMAPSRFEYLKCVKS